MIEQNVSVAGTTDISFTVPHADLATAAEVSRALQPEIAAREVTADPGHRDGVDHRGRDEDPSRGLGDHVRGPRPGRHQHRDDLDLLHPAHLRGARRSGRGRGGGAAPGVQAGGRVDVDGRGVRRDRAGRRGHACRARRPPFSP